MEGDIAYTLQQSSNSFDHFLLLTELKIGGSRRSIMLENLVLHLIQNTQQKQQSRIYFIHER